MIRRLCLLVLMAPIFSILLLSAGASVATAETAINTTPDKAYDEKITSSVKSKLATEDALTHIQVKTVEGTVYLNGVVPSIEKWKLAEELSRQVEGVQRLVNFLRVVP